VLRSRTWITIVGSLLILLAVGCRAKEAETIEVKLALVVGKAPKPIATAITLYYLGQSPPPDSHIAPPEPKGCTLTAINYLLKPMSVAYVPSKDKKRIDRLWIDFNLNSKFDSYEKAVNIGAATGLPQYDYMLFKKDPIIRGRPVQIVVFADGLRGLGIAGNGCLKGDADIGGKKVEFTIFDSDLDGIYGSSDGFSGDQISYKIGKNYNYTDTSGFLAVGFGLYYKPFVDGSKRTMTLIKYTSKLGRIETARGKIASLGLFDRQRQFQAVSDNTSVSVPEGKYSLCQADLEIKGEDGQTYSVGYRLDKGMNIEVKNDHPIFLGFREKPTMKVSARAGQGFAEIRMGLYDKDDWRVMYITPASGTKPAAPVPPDPTVTIIDRRGQQVASSVMSSYWIGKFYLWKLPKGATPGN